MAVATPPQSLPSSSDNLIAPPGPAELAVVQTLAYALANPERYSVGLTIDGQPLPTPGPVLAAMRRLCEHLAAGRAVTLIPHRTTLTPRQAAELLGISRPYLMRLLQQGQLHSSKVGAHHRLTLDEVLRYRARRDADFEATMDEMTLEAEEAGGYR